MPEMLFWLDKLADQKNLSYVCMSNCPPVFRVGPIFTKSSGMSFQIHHQKLLSRWSDAERYEEFSNTAQASKAATVWVSYAMAAVATGHIIQFLLTGESPLLGRSFLFDMELLSCWWGKQ